MMTFSLEPDQSATARRLRPSGYEGLPGEVLLENAHWFTHIRWCVIGSLMAAGVACWVLPQERMQELGIATSWGWFLAFAAVLAALNIIESRWVLSIRNAEQRRAVVANVWFQIITDLTVLSLLVYRVGPLNTVIAFAYLFHIVLACIFFGRRDSFFITLLSALLFICTVTVSTSGWLPYRSIIIPMASGTWPVAIHVTSVIFVLFVVWLLTASLSNAVRHRDAELDAANARLRRADEEKNQQMLRVTHDLKAPFAGIESNIQVLRALHWDAIPTPVQQIIAKIERRATSLRTRIGDILMLGSLRSDNQNHKPETIDLRKLIDDTREELRGLSAKRSVDVLVEGDARVYNDGRQLKMLLSNLVSNAITYSKEGSQVSIRVKDGKPVRVQIIDKGIGIPDTALPHIFEDFYRTKDAAAFNAQSTGLGLAIVRQIAGNLGLTINVSSAPAEGTTFEVCIPEAA